MSGRVERVRVGLIAGSVLLLMVLAGVYSYARYRAAKSWLSKIQKRSGVSIEQGTDNYTYSQSLKGRTIFTLRAAKGIPHANGAWTLHNVVLTVYGTTGNRTDRVYGNTFEWDDKLGIARAIGEVQMDLQVPSGVVATQRRGSPATGDATGNNSIHVKTSGLVFLRKLGVAATQEPIEFHYGGLTCVAKGAEFDSSPSALHLLSEVRMNGELRGQPISLTAYTGDFDRSTNVVSFVRPVLVSEDRKAHAESAVLYLRKDGSVEHAQAMGAVGLDAATTHLTGQRLDAVLSEKNEPQTARLSGGVKMVDDNAARPSHGEAGEMRLRFDGQGRPAEMTAIHNAHLVTRETAANGTGLDREIRGEQIVAAFHAEGKEKPRLQQVHASGGASMRGDSLAKAVGTQKARLKSTNIAGDDLLMNFVPLATDAKKIRIDKLHGQGHTVLRQTAALGEEHVSSGDLLDVVFADDAGGEKAGESAVASAVQVGHVAISSRPALKVSAKGKVPETTTGNAERAAYDGATERLTLTGGVHVADGGTSLVAESVTVDQRTGDAEARGNVAATLSGRGAATHVSAQQAVLHKVTQVAEFDGVPGKPARMWQDASQVEAGHIALDRLKNTLEAKPGLEGGVVHSVFAAEAAKRPGTAEKGPSILRVESRAMEYSDAQHSAVFSGPVKIDGAMGEVRGQRTIVYFTPVAKDSAKAKGGELGVVGGALDHVVVAGDVKIEQPGRHGSGDQLLYKAADSSFVLSGTPTVAPRIVDAQQGIVTGASLLFRSGGKTDSTIVVTGAPATGEQRPQRARIETRVRQKSE